MEEGHSSIVLNTFIALLQYFIGIVSSFVHKKRYPHKFEYQWLDNTAD